ncbi:unnamed protein product [Lymnaea stagnalis]|uniref:Protein kinase domain-containing protein n=1 Tax=Lymnaea stagnalis TaxID=6523 RepID=A0AAV2IAB7_LYMST
MSKRYVDNAANRRLGRVGMVHGTAVHSRSSNSSSFSSSPTTYVDNAMNRSLGRVGMDHGTAVHSRSSSGYGGSTSGYGGSASSNFYVDNPMNRSLGRVGMEHGTAVHSRSSNASSASYSVSSPRTYVDNPMNRSLSRVGMEHGTAVHSRSSNASSASYSSSSPITYVDNPLNRSLGRVGLEHGTAVHSRSSSGHSGRTGSNVYVDNAMNQRLGRVGMEHGTAVHSRLDSGSSNGSNLKTYVDNPTNRSLGRVGLEHGTAVHSRPGSGNSSSSSSPKTYVDNPMNRSLDRVGMEHGTATHSRLGSGNSSSSSSTKTYVNNPMNRSLGRVGMEHGTAVHSRSDDSLTVRLRGMTVKDSRRNSPGKVYVDNSYNRKYNRVGKPLGSMPIPAEERVYKDTPLNRQLGRVGLPWGTYVNKEKPQTALLQKIKALQGMNDVPEHIADDYENDANAQDFINQYLEMVDRERNVATWLEEKPGSWNPHEHTSRQVIEKYRGKIIDYNELRIMIQIGHGGFGDVFMAEWVEDQLVAVKKLRVQRVSKKRLKQFEDEISLYCQLDHVNIVRFLGACIVPPNLAIVMEYMDLSLYEALHINQVDFTNDDKINMMRDVADGMAYLHFIKIAHCDLKTQNVLLNNVPGKQSTDAKQPVLAKITDFGLSMMKSDDETSTSGMMARFIGTPRYSAPEVLRGELLNVDQLMQADIYSLGLVILELVIEEIAFENLSLHQLRTQVGEKGLKPSISKNLQINHELLTKLRNCWSFDPSGRPGADVFSLFANSFNDFIIY